MILPSAYVHYTNGSQTGGQDLSDRSQDKSDGSQNDEMERVDEKYSSAIHISVHFFRKSLLGGTISRHNI